MDFTGKLVVITGVGRAGQVGEAVALGFAQRGATLALLDLQQTEVEARAATLRAAGYAVTSHVANLADAAAAKAAAAEVIAATQDRFGGAVHAETKSPISNKPARDFRKWNINDCSDNAAEASHCDERFQKGTERTALAQTIARLQGANLPSESRRPLRGQRRPANGPPHSTLESRATA